MKKNYNARKFRQLKNSIASLKSILKSSNPERHESLIRQLNLKIKFLLQELSAAYSRFQLKKVVAGLALALACIAPQQAAAQHFDPAAQSAFGMSAYDQFVDLDNDGDLDIINTVSQYGYYQYGYGGYGYYVPGFHRLTYRINTVTGGESSFGSSVTVIDGYGPSIMKPALADLDGDGDLDLIIDKSNSYYSDDLIYVVNDGSASAPDFGYNNDQLLISSIGNYNQIAPILRDIDADGDLDLFMGHYAGLTYYQNTGTGETPNFSTPPVNNPFDMTSNYGSRKLLIDIDFDGDFDFITGTNNSMEMLENIGTASAPSFSATISNPFGLSIGNNNTCEGQFIDFDGDTDLDFLSSSTGSQLKYFENTGSGTPAFTTVVNEPFCIDFLQNYYNLFIGDLEGDSDLDLFASNSYLHYYENNPLGTTYYRDFDNDSWGDLQSPLVSTSCSIPVGYVFNSIDCNDADAAVYMEINWYADSDADGYGDGDASLFACSQPAGYVNDWSDCDDNNGLFHTLQYLYTDADFDGFGDANGSVTAQCLGMPGYSTNNLDCNDLNASISPIAMDIPNNTVDENCDGQLNYASLEEISIDRFNLYPNPGTEKLSINSSFDPSEIQTITCHAIDGTNISLGSIQDLLQKGVFEINTANWNSGIYIFSIQVKDQAINLKWVKN